MGNSVDIKPSPERGISPTVREGSSSRVFGALPYGRASAPSRRHRITPRPEVKSLFENRFHMFSANLTMRLGICIFSQARAPRSLTRCKESFLFCLSFAREYLAT